MGPRPVRLNRGPPNRYTDSSIGRGRRELKEVSVILAAVQSVGVETGVKYSSQIVPLALLFMVLLATVCLWVEMCWIES